MKLHEIVLLEKLDVDTIVKHYLIAALRSSVEADSEVPLDNMYDLEDISPESVKRAKADVEKFLQLMGHLKNNPELQDSEQLGHDFWLTRNHHGAGFWDRKHKKEIGDKLTSLAHKFGEINAVVGDDKKIHLEGGRKVTESVSPLKDDTLRYGIESFEFLLPVNKLVTSKEFAELIAQHYSVKNPRTKEMVEKIKNTDFRIVAQRNGKTKIFYGRQETELE